MSHEKTIQDGWNLYVLKQARTLESWAKEQKQLKRKASNQENKKQRQTQTMPPVPILQPLPTPCSVPPLANTLFPSSKQEKATTLLLLASTKPPMISRPIIKPKRRPQKLELVKPCKAFSNQRKSRFTPNLPIVHELKNRIPKKTDVLFGKSVATLLDFFTQARTRQTARMSSGGRRPLQRLKKEEGDEEEGDEEEGDEEEEEEEEKVHGPTEVQESIKEPGPEPHQQEPQESKPEPQESKPEPQESRPEPQESKPEPQESRPEPQQEPQESRPEPRKSKPESQEPQQEPHQQEFQQQEPQQEPQQGPQADEKKETSRKRQKLTVEGNFLKIVEDVHTNLRLGLLDSCNCTITAVATFAQSAMELIQKMRNDIMCQTMKALSEADDESTVLLTFQNNMCFGGGFRQDLQYFIPWKKIKNTLIGQRFGSDKFLYLGYDMSFPPKASEEDRQICKCIQTLTKDLDVLYDAEMGDGATQENIKKLNSLASFVPPTLLYDAEMDDGPGQENIKKLNSLASFVPPTRFIVCRGFC